MRAARIAAPLAFCAAAGALAYIPTANTLLRRAAARAAEGRRAREGTLLGTLQLGEAPPLPATLSLRFPNSCKLEAEGLSVAARADPGRAQLAGGEGREGARELLRLACPLIAYRGQRVDAAEQTLRAAALGAGVPADFSPLSLTRLYDHVVVVLGAAARQLDRPQLWLYRENGAPARLLAQSGTHLDDLRLLQYGNPAAGEWMPRVLELWRGEARAARFEVAEARGLRPAATDEEEADDARE